MPKSSRFEMRIAPDKLQQYTDAAKKAGLSRAEWIEIALDLKLQLDNAVYSTIEADCERREETEYLDIIQIEKKIALPQDPIQGLYVSKLEATPDGGFEIYFSNGARQYLNSEGKPDKRPTNSSD